MSSLMLFVLMITLINGSSGIDDSESIKPYSEEIGKILKSKILHDFASIQKLNELYQSFDLKSGEFNPLKLTEDRADVLSRLLKNREILVEKLAEEAEKFHNLEIPGETQLDDIQFYALPTETSNNDTDEVSDSEPVKSEIFYRNAKCGCGYQSPSEVDISDCFSAQNRSVLNRHFGVFNVSYNLTAVHIPTDVYNQGPEVLRDIYFGQGMTNTLREVVCSEDQYSHLNRWAYYATKQGVLRFFPERVWGDDCNTPDVFDSRLSQWYIQSASSPKDVIVLVDVSGSVQGLTMNLFYHAVRHLLDTLTANDFVNIVLFNEEAKLISDKCTGLLQATSRNKQILLNLMNDIEICDKSSFEKGFDLALGLVNKSSDAKSHANCNPIIFLLTDGEAIYPTEALKKWNPDNSKRVFAYAVGKNFYDKDSVKEIACENRGDFKTIPSFTSTRPQVQSYLGKISEPLVQSSRKMTKWTLPYKDQLGLGTVLTVSVPFHDITSSNSPKFLGVAAVDLLLDDIRQAVSDATMGADFYPFIIDNNGLVVLHPDLIEDAHKDVLNVDLMELEDETIAKVREYMINEETGIDSMDKQVIFDRRYKTKSRYDIVYSPISGSVFKLGFSIHSSKAKFLNVSAEEVYQHYPNASFDNLEQTEDTVHLLYSDPCDSVQVNTFNPCSRAEADLIGKVNYQGGISLQEYSKIAQCDHSSMLYNGLLLHSQVMQEISQDDFHTNITNRSGVLAVFTAIESPSFLRIKFLNIEDQSEDRLDGKIVKNKIIEVLSNPRQRSYLRRPVHQPTWAFYSYVPITFDLQVPLTVNSSNETTTQGNPINSSTPITENKSSHSGFIVVSQAVVTSQDDPVVAPVMTGIVLDPASFTENLFDLTYKCSGIANCSINEEMVKCKDAEKIQCLLLDDGGFLISSNQESHIDKMNKFFGLTDGEFMKSLISEGVYDKMHIYNYQALCDKKENDKSAGTGRYGIPTIADLISFSWWFSTSAFMFLQTVIQTGVLLLWSIADVGRGQSSVQSAEMQKIQEHCILKSAVLNFGLNSDMHFGSFKCTEICSRGYVATHIENTNVLLIIADTVSSCREDCSFNSVFSNEEGDVTHDDLCNNRTSSSRFRKPPNGVCYDAGTFEKEKDSPCSSASSVIPSWHIIPNLLIASYLTDRYHRNY